MAQQSKAERESSVLDKNQSTDLVMGCMLLTYKLIGCYVVNKTPKGVFYIGDRKETL